LTPGATRNWRPRWRPAAGWRAAALWDE
jgi:hypothetical protein